jgi:hypothetical protein
MLYKTHKLLILMYGKKAWAWTKRDISRLHAVEMKFVKSIEK